MFYAEVTTTEKIHLIFNDKNVKINSNTYQYELLSKIVVSLKQSNPNRTFQQDWAPAQGAKATLAFLDTHVPGYLKKDEWPSNNQLLGWRLLRRKFKEHETILFELVPCKLINDSDDWDQTACRYRHFCDHSFLSLCKSDWWTFWTICLNTFFVIFGFVNIKQCHDVEYFFLENIVFVRAPTYQYIVGK